MSLLFEYLHFELQYSLINTVTVRFCMYAVALINKVGGGESDGEVLGDHDRCLKSTHPPAHPFSEANIKAYTIIHEQTSIHLPANDGQLNALKSKVAQKTIKCNFYKFVQWS